MTTKAFALKQKLVAIAPYLAATCAGAIVTGIVLHAIQPKPISDEDRDLLRMRDFADDNDMFTVTKNGNKFVTDTLTEVVEQTPGI